MGDSNNWIDSETAKILERAQDVPKEAITKLIDLLKDKLSTETLTKTELPKIGADLLSLMNIIEPAKDETNEN